MNEFKLGTNFDFDILNDIIKLNANNTDKITEVYGSDRAHAALTARPDFRLVDISKEDFERYVKIAKDNGIKFNYTMNSIIPYGSKIELVKHMQEVVDFIHYLEDVGVYRITVANPMMLEIIRNVAKSNIEIEISTIMHIDTVTQIKYLHEKYNVNKVCCNLNKNRDFNFLKAAAKYCNKNGIILELMANEFCGNGGSNYATHCIYRDSCYICHATNKTYEDAELLNGYPMNICTTSRNKDIANWLKLKFIRPEDLVYYNNIGIHHFKITGRTATSEYITKVMTAYMSKHFEGNLLELWKPLESINHDELEKEHAFYIDNAKLNGFLKHWLKGHNCDNEVCGETCAYCNLYYHLHVKEK